MAGAAARRTVKILASVAAAFALLIAVFDWNWFRGAVEHYFSENSGREVSIGHLDVDLSLVPTVRMRDIYVENAPWASKRPLIKARELAVTFSLRSAWHGRPLISRLVITHGEVDLERRADGLRNWRLRRPENRAPGQVRVLVFEAHNTTVRFVNGERDLELLATSTPIVPSGEAAALREPGLTTRVTFEGRYKGAPFTGEGLNGGFMSFRHSGVSFPLRGHLASGKTYVEVDGVFSDVFDIGPFESAVRVRGPSLSTLHPFLPLRPAPSRRFDLSAHVTGKNNVYTFSKLSGDVGTTHLSGTVVFDRGGERPRVQAEVVSPSADFEDLRALFGVRATEAPSARSTGLGAARSRLFPTRRLDAQKLRTFDAQLKLTARKLTGAPNPMLGGFSLEAVLHAGNLRVDPLDVGFAGGRVVGNLAFDAREETASVSAALELRDLRLERLFPALAQKAAAGGAVRGRLEIAGQGQSVAAIVTNATGALSARIENGSISNIADAKLGLQFGKLVGALLKGERRHAIRCGAVAFQLANAVARSRALVLETEQTAVRGRGTIDLRQEYVDLLLTPEPKEPSLLTRRASVRVEGPFRALRTTVVERVEQSGGAKIASCGA